MFAVNAVKMICLSKTFIKARFKINMAFKPATLSRRLSVSVGIVYAESINMASVWRHDCAIFVWNVITIQRHLLNGPYAKNKNAPPTHSIKVKHCLKRSEGNIIVVAK